MDDAVIPVAYAMHASPKRYALLLGSGISTSTGLPTGSVASGNMIRKIALGRAESIEGGNDPIVCLEWFERTFGVPATFDRLMEKLGISEENRSDGLLPFIIPCDEAGHPITITPTPAHKAIAKLVKDGLISTIITTNFDHLLEGAIKDAIGVPPLIVTEETDPSLMSVFPDKCRIVKVNGDFTSKKLRITPEDLKSYDSTMEDYIRRISSEYGLVVCGWSGKFDTGLVEILKALKVRRYPMFWTLRSDGEIPECLNTTLKPIPIQVETANEFFTSTQTIIERFRLVERDQPLPLQVAIRKITEALQQPRPDIILTELLHKETDIVLDEIAKDDYVPLGQLNVPILFQSRVVALQKRTEPLAAMLATIAYYDDGHYSDLVYDVIERLINIQYSSPFSEGSRQLIGFGLGVQKFKDCLYQLRLLPALLVIFSTGIAATKAVHLNMLEAVLSPKILETRDFPMKRMLYMQYVNPRVILGGSDLWVNLNRSLFGESGNIYLYPYNITYNILNHLIPNRDRYSQMYDVFEYLFGLAFFSYYKGAISQYQFDAGQIPALESRLCNVSCHTYPPGRMIRPLYIAEYSNQIKNMLPRTSAVGSTVFFGKIDDYRRCENLWEIIFGLREWPETPLKGLDDLIDSNDNVPGLL